jgi:hypothetical protein
MISQIEKWFMIGIGIIILMMFVGAGLASHQRDSCRLELAKAGRSAEDIIKICP